MPRVLVIDDEPDVLMLCRVNLRHEGHEVLEALDGETGVALAVENPPDAVVLDLLLPAMDGFEVLTRLRGTEMTTDVPIVVLTAKAQIEDQRLAFESGADVFLSKPFVPEELAQIVGALLTSGPAERSEWRAAALRALAE
ncbi:MAG: response regulator [Actinomycetota bacterium]